MDILNFILWNIDPELPFVKELWPVRWYGVLFASGFLIGQRILVHFFKKVNLGEKEVDQLTIHVVIGVVLGARLGHCFFYDPHYYLIENPLEILQIWKGGLASHGATIGIILSLYIYFRKNRNLYSNYMWLADRVIIVVALSAGLIRMGNLMNSEIVGKPTDASYGFIFTKNTEIALEDYYKQIEDVRFSKTGKEIVRDGFTYPELEMTVLPVEQYEIHDQKEATEFATGHLIPFLDHYDKSDQYAFVPKDYQSQISFQNGEIKMTVLGIPRHPAQLYEALSLFVLFIIILIVFKKYNDNPPEGVVAGTFVVIVFSLRFVYELIKENQVSMEDGWVLNMGQILSIPAILFGIGLVVYSLNQRKNQHVKP